ncbi:amidohydrolase family protein [Nocardia sp. IFM 10818]
MAGALRTPPPHARRRRATDSRQRRRNPTYTPRQLPRSLAVWTDLDLTPVEILDLATRQAAEALRLGEVTGTLTAGHAADLIAVPGDPTTDLDALTTPILVATAGHLHPDADTAEENT